MSKLLSSPWRNLNISQDPFSVALLALMDEAYTGSLGGGEAGSSDEGDISSSNEINSLFFNLLKDENDGMAAQKKCIEFVLAAFRQRPHFIAVMKKPIMDRLGQPHTSTAKAELALQLCWAVGEYAGGEASYKDAARQLFEALELVLYENLSSSRASRRGMGAERLKMPGAFLPGTPAQARLLSFVVNAIAKLASSHRELAPRARVCLAKVTRSFQVLDKAVWQRAQDYLGLMNEPAIFSSILESSVSSLQHPRNIQWSEASKTAVANIPFYLLGEKDGPPYHDFRLCDVLGNKFMST